MSLSLFLVFVLAVPMALVVGSASASLSKPEFTVQYVDHSYDVPPTYGKDAYTGQTIIVSGGYHVDNRTIDVTIRNQPFASYNASGHMTQLYYNVRSKGHFEDWNGASVRTVNAFEASASGYTVVSINIAYWSVREGGQIDFQVQAIAGYPAADAAYCGSIHFTTVEEGPWSDIQTITIGSASLPSPTVQPYVPFPTPDNTWEQNSPTLPPAEPTENPIMPNMQSGVLLGVDFERMALIIMVVAVVVMALSMVVLWRRLATK
ncbi:MAG: hypothetical protein NWE98_08080 [Candidatus Bathyarchaeota archaeon]|nr:hypothetical protein [Candidatus Bathyarchaeota archaeon]